MLLDNNGDVVFIYTPPSLRSRSVSKARDPQHAAKLFKAHLQDLTGRWATFHFSSHDNPTISRDALAEITGDMSRAAYRMEIMAEDLDEAPGALWTHALLDSGRVNEAPPLTRIVVGIDPAATSGETASETGIIVAGLAANGDGYVLEDLSGHYTPGEWGAKAVTAFEGWKADRIVPEVNNGGEMVTHTVQTASRDLGIPVRVKPVHASRGKATRAEPVVALFEQGKIHLVGTFPGLEDQLCLWVPGDDSPDRLDSLVWCMTDLMLGRRRSEWIIV
jgi:phage terminase large subunit-like protein